MSGITLITAAHIAANPRDLMISISEENGMWTIETSRGPGADFKRLLTSGPVEATMDRLLEDIPFLLLDDIVKPVLKELESSGSFLAAMFCGKDEKVDTSGFLDKDMADWIVKQLRESKCAMTWTREP